MTYTPDITGFPYWKIGGPYATAVKVERNSWDKVAKDLMRLSGLKQDLEKSVGKTEDWLDEEMLKNEKLIKEKKSLKKENKFYLKKIEKIKKKILEIESKKDENFKKAAEGWATIRGLKDIIKRKDDLINEAVSKREYDRLWDENASNEEEIKELKEEKFDNMEELAKRDGMCLVDIHIFDKLMAQEEENKELKEELKAAQEVSVVYMKRYEQKAKEERQIDEICSRIKCDDKFGHLIGKVPHH